MTAQVDNYSASLAKLWLSKHNITLAAFGPQPHLE